MTGVYKPTFNVWGQNRNHHGSGGSDAFETWGPDAFSMGFHFGNDVFEKWGSSSSEPDGTWVGKMCSSVVQRRNMWNMGPQNSMGF